MHEDDGQRRVGRADLLHREQHAVVGHDQRRAVGAARGLAERVVLAELRAALVDVRWRGAQPPAGGNPADRDADRGAGGGQADDGTGDAGGLPLGDVVLLRVLRHQSAPAEPT